MSEAGMKAFSHRREAGSRIYAHELAPHAGPSKEDAAPFRKNKAAWTFFEAQALGYRHLNLWREISAKRAGTRQSRLAMMIDASAQGRRL